MKPNKFDETIRQKLEGIQPNFREEDWTKFRTYQSAQVSPSFIQRFGRTMLYTAASLVGAVMVFANAYQYRKNEQLDQQLQQLKGQFTQKVNTPTPVLSRVDTVYITKYIPLQSSRINQYDATVPSINNVQPKEFKVENIDNEAQKAVLKTYDDFEKQFSGKTTNRATIRTENEKNGSINRVLSSKEKDEESELTEKQSYLSLQPRNVSQSTKNQHIDSQLKSMNGEDVARKEETNEILSNKETVSNIELNSLETSLLEPNQILEELTSITPAELKVQRYAYAYQSVSSSASEASPAEAKTTPPPPSISFRGMKFRMGAGINIGDRFTAKSLNTSVLLGKYWSIDVGLSNAQISGPQFYTEDIFRVKTKRDFEAWHKSSSAPQLIPSQVYDIKTSVSLVRIPISLTYRWPVKDGFTLLMSGGTNLNLSANQAFSFFTRDRNGELVEKKGAFDIKPALSNDIMVAAGIEKQWRYLVFQGEAYTAPYLQKPTYLTENRNIGVRFKITYQFGKK